MVKSINRVWTCPICQREHFGFVPDKNAPEKLSDYTEYIRDLRALYSETGLCPRCEGKMAPTCEEGHALDVLLEGPDGGVRSVCHQVVGDALRFYARLDSWKVLHQCRSTTGADCHCTISQATFDEGEFAQMALFGQHHEHTVVTVAGTPIQTSRLHIR